MFIDFESEYWKKGLKVAGIDEAGRGALAGPVVAASVILENFVLSKSGVKDSKQLSIKQREKIFFEVIDKSEDYSYSSIDNIIIDELNILKATHLAMKCSVESLKISPDLLLIDGNSYSFNEIPFKTIIDGDEICLSISAASIIAKVKRDEWITEIAHSEFPEYNFKQNKGYGTKEHLKAIEKHGICKYHRLSFLKKFYQKQKEISLF